MNDKIYTMWGECVQKHTKTPMNWQDAANDFAKQIVGETVLAILATDCRSFTYTTYDKGVVDAVIARVVDKVRDHWEFQ